MNKVFTVYEQLGNKNVYFVGRDVEGSKYDNIILILCSVYLFVSINFFFSTGEE